MRLISRTPAVDAEDMQSRVDMVVHAVPDRWCLPRHDCPRPRTTEVGPGPAAGPCLAACRLLKPGAGAVTPGSGRRQATLLAERGQPQGRRESRSQSPLRAVSARPRRAKVPTPEVRCVAAPSHRNRGPRAAAPSFLAWAARLHLAVSTLRRASTSRAGQKSQCPRAGWPILPTVDTRLQRMRGRLRSLL